MGYIQRFIREHQGRGGEKRGEECPDICDPESDSRMTREREAAGGELGGGSSIDGMPPSRTEKYCPTKTLSTESDYSLCRETDVAQRLFVAFIPKAKEDTRFGGVHITPLHHHTITPFHREGAPQVSE